LVFVACFLPVGTVPRLAYSHMDINTQR
jgi:hypothetical protein